MSKAIDYFHLLILAYVSRSDGRMYLLLYSCKNANAKMIHACAPRNALKSKIDNHENAITKKEVVFAFLL